MSAAKSSAACSDGEMRCRASASIRCEIPQGVQVAIAGGLLTAKGRLGELKLELTEHIEATVEGNKVTVKPRTEERQARMMWGTTRALVATMVQGVSAGYESRWRSPAPAIAPRCRARTWS